MRIIRYHSTVPAEARGAAVAVGNFDGIHRGHQAVFDVARRIAREQSVPFAIFTFEPHPRSVIQPDVAPFRLTPLRIKVRVLDSLDVDIVYLARFDWTMAGKLWSDFVGEILVESLGVRHVVVGYDFRFGKGRAGTPEQLGRMAKEKGFEFTCVGAVGDGVEFSSTRIRDALRAGDVREAAHVLGRWWEVEDRVARGAARGRELGYRTANLDLGPVLVPARGIYAVWAGLAGPSGIVWRAGAASFGNRPTFDGTRDLLEVHIFDFDEDLYGRRLCVRFVEYLRPELRFDEVASLEAQIAEDCARAREVLGRVHPEGPDALESVTE